MGLLVIYLAPVERQVTGLLSKIGRNFLLCDVSMKKLISLYPVEGFIISGDSIHTTSTSDYGESSVTEVQISWVITRGWSSLQATSVQNKAVASTVEL